MRGLVLDYDLNSETLNACGEAVSPDGFGHASAKQEISSNYDEWPLDVYGHRCYWLLRVA
jgi:hypothetical protein